MSKIIAEILDDDDMVTILTLYFIIIYSCFVIYLTYMIVDRFGTVLSFYVLLYCIIIQCSSYLATWLPFLINRLDWIGWCRCSGSLLADGIYDEDYGTLAFDGYLVH